MINAHVEMDLNQHIVVVSAKAVELIQLNDEIILESLMKKFLKKYEVYTPEQFMDALVFLFSIDCLIVSNYKVILKDV